MLKKIIDKIINKNSHENCLPNDLIFKSNYHAFEYMLNWCIFESDQLVGIVTEINDSMFVCKAKYGSHDVIDRVECKSNRFDGHLMVGDLVVCLVITDILIFGSFILEPILSFKKSGWRIKYMYKNIGGNQICIKTNEDLYYRCMHSEKPQGLDVSINKK